MGAVMGRADTEIAPERLQKYLSAIGIGSRRKIETWIEQGKISVNGRTAQLGDKVTPACQIKIAGRPLKGWSRNQSGKFAENKQQQRIILYNKPEGEICTRSDPKNRPTVFRHLPILKGARWVAVGRLDINTRGLMLFTNDGDLANHLMHPKLELEREYLCRVYGTVDDESLNKLTTGLEIGGHLGRFIQVKRQRGEHRNTWYSVIVKQGKYREVRRMWAAIGCKLSRLCRIRYGKIALPRGIKLGDWIELSPDLIRKLEQNDDNEKVVTPKLAKKSGQRSKRR